MIHIFVDTNIFLHFRFFMEVPWEKLYGVEYQIVLAPVVVDELDKHKRNPNTKIAARAKKVLSRIEQIVREPGSFPLLYLTKRPGNETFQNFQLDRQEQDDCILAAIIEFREKHNGEDILFISNDTGPRFRASSLEIKSGELPEEFQNPNELSEEQKKIQKLTQENNKLKNAMPKLSLTFDNGSRVLNYAFDHFQEVDQSTMDSEYNAIASQYAQLAYEDPLERTKRLQQMLNSTTNFSEKIKYMNLLHPLDFSCLSAEQVENYNESLAGFLGKYKKYIHKKYKHKEIVALTMPVNIQMHNTGNSPATDIDIWLHFPDGFFVVREDQYPGKPKEPKPPYKPKHKFDFEHRGSLFNPSIYLPERTESASPKINLHRPEIRKTNSYEVDIQFKNLKHFNSIGIDELLVVYPSASEVVNFTIDYKITASNIPDQIIGKLSIVAKMGR